MSPMGNKIYRDSICRTIYNLIRLQGDTTRQFLTDTTKLAPTSLNRILDRLITAGWITESGLASSTGGRRANLYSQRTEHTAFLVVRLDRSSARLGLFDPALQFLAQEEITGYISRSETSADNADEEAAKQSENISTEDSKSFSIWLNDLQSAVRKIITALKTDRELSLIYALLNEDSGLKPDQLILVKDALNAAAGGRKLSSMPLIQADCAAYGTLWKPASGRLGEATIVLIADLETTYICQAGDGLRHAGGLQALEAGELIVPLLQGDKPLTLAKAGQSDGLLKQFSRIKQSQNLNWHDLTEAAAAGKKKAAQTMSIAAAAFASAIINSAILVQADYWILTGTMTEELPGLIIETEKQMSSLLKKSDILLQRLDITESSDQLIWQGAAARLLEEQLGILD